MQSCCLQSCCCFPSWFERSAVAALWESHNYIFPHLVRNLISNLISISLSSLMKKASHHNLIEDFHMFPSALAIVNLTCIRIIIVVASLNTSDICTFQCSQVLHPTALQCCLHSNDSYYFPGLHVVCHALQTLSVSFLFTYCNCVCRPYKDYSVSTALWKSLTVKFLFAFLSG